MNAISEKRRPTSKITTEIEREAYKAGDFIFFEGDIDFHMYIIDMGEVQIFTKNKSGERIEIATLEEGDSFGEFALLDKKPRSASAQASTACVVYKVSEQGYEHLLEELPAWASSMLRNFSVRMRRMNELVKNLPQFVDKKDY